MSDEENQVEVTEVANGELDTAQAVETEESAASTGETETVEQEATDKDDATAKPNGAQKRIDELTHKRRSAERERDYWREQALNSQPQPESAVQPEVSSAPPTLESAGYDEGVYQQKMAEWTQSQISQQLDERLTQREQTAQQANQKQAFAAKAQKFAAENPDYHEVAENPYLPISESMAEVLTTSDKGPEVLYYLGKNTEEAQRISQLSPTHAALELGRLEATLSLPKAKTVSEAPPPIEPINGGGETPATDPEKMTPAQFREWRNKQLMDKRGYT